MEEIIIKQSFKKQITLTFMGILMLFLSFLTYNTAEILYSSKFAKIFLKITGLIGIIFFGLAFLFIIYRLFKPKNILTINIDGFIDNSSAISLGYIPWSEVEKIKEFKVISERFIGVELKNEEEYLKRTSNIKLKLLKINLKIGYPIISINLNSTKADIEVITLIMIEYYSYWKENNK